jgi:phenylpropionate dioxygenase-like ring-hydroxylating dioxygenase large terminal subunit
MNAKIHDNQAPNAEPAFQYGRSLPRSFYSDNNVHASDLSMLGATQWILVDHVSRLRQAGDYFLFDFGHESLIFIKDKQGEIHGLFNVCRHRGSRVCLESQGHVHSLICPYHAWNYGLDGRLKAAAAMPEGFDKSQYGLEAAHVQVYAGLIFVNLARGPAPDFDRFIDRLKPYLALHGLEHATIAVRASYPTTANWKLVVENFLECYHCKPAHATYCSVHSAEKLLVFGAGPGSSGGSLASKYEKELAEWQAIGAIKGYLTAMFSDDPESEWFQTGCRLPIGQGYSTEAVGGSPVAPLMGSFKEYDGAQTAIVLNPLSYIMASNDYAAVMRFTPRAPTTSDVEMIWLVKEGAVAGRDYDPKRLTQVWDVTLREDKIITENNQLGVLSSRYNPGPHSLHERRISDFLAWYNRRMHLPSAP